MTKELAERMFNAIKQEPVFYRHICKTGTRVGSQSLYIAPMTAWSKHIEVMVDTNNRNVFKKAIERFKVAHTDIVEDVRFIKSTDGSTTPYLRFIVKQ